MKRSWRSGRAYDCNRDGYRYYSNREIELFSSLSIKKRKKREELTQEKN